jgi:hypothetical protein
VDKATTLCGRPAEDVAYTVNEKLVTCSQCRKLIEAKRKEYRHIECGYELKDGRITWSRVERT